MTGYFLQGRRHLQGIALLSVMLVLSACGTAPENASPEPALEVQAQILELKMSRSADRSSRSVLDAAAVSGTIHVFVDRPGLESVTYYLNDKERAGRPFSKETVAPFDFVGTDAESGARGFDTTTLPDGMNTITADLRYADGRSKVVTANFLVINTEASPYSDALLISNSASRSSAEPLRGQYVSDEVYIFLVPTESVQNIEFYLDGEYQKRERYPFYDFAATAYNGSAYPFDTSALSEGEYTVSALITRSSGRKEEVSATFNVGTEPVETPAPPAPNPPEPGDPEPGDPEPNPDPDPEPKPDPEPEPNTAPKVNAGTDQTITLPASANLQASVEDDGKPGGELTLTWSKVSGPGEVSFADAKAEDTEVSFSKAGDYELQLEASDGELSGSDRVSVTVKAEPAPEPKTGIESLKLSSNDRYFRTSSGKPFFPLADTMWGLATLSESEADLYFKTRKAQGFNTILGPVVWGSKFKIPSGEGMERPLKEDGKYYRHLDMLVRKAKEHGLYLGIVMQWGETNRMQYYGSTGKAYDYAKWIAARYKNEPHVFWYVSGEYNKEGDKWNSYYKAIGKGIKEVVGSRQLVSIHPIGGGDYNNRSSSYRFHDESWLDFNSIQTWTNDDSTYKRTEDDWNERPVKPVFVSETKYEGEGPDAFRMRRLAYWSVFSGSLGFGYGHGNIWSGKRDGKDWKGALKATGGNDMQHVSKLIMSRAETPSGSTLYFDRVPDDGVILSSNTSSDGERGHMAATRDRNGKYFMVYIPTDGSAREVKVNMSDIAGSKAKAWWYNPSSGSTSEIGTYDASGSRTFKTPGSGDDWILVVDDAGMRWGAPGK